MSEYDTSGTSDTSGTYHYRVTILCSVSRLSDYLVGSLGSEHGLLDLILLAFVVRRDEEHR